MKTLVASFTLVLAIGLVGAGCRSMTGQSFGQEVEDKQITAAVKAKLVADRAKNLTAIDVDTVASTVYLTGFVDTAQQKRDAETLAKTVGGVKRVVNNLQIQQKAPTTASGTRAPAPPPTPAASPSTATLMGRHTMTGEVKDVDRDRGRVELRTADGDMQLYFPPAAVRNVQKGDRITVELAVSPAR
jgi:hyperosmotically inducible protein